MDQKSALLPLLSIAAAVSVVAFSGIGVAAITGHLPIAKSSLNPFSAFGGVPALRTSDSNRVSSHTHEGFTRSAGSTSAQGQQVNFRPGARLPARKASCANCGIVDSIKAQGASGDDGKKHAAALGTPGRAYQSDGGKPTSFSFVVIVRMENGTVRTIHENQRPPFGIGERVKLVNGTVIPSS